MKFEFDKKLLSVGYFCWCWSGLCCYVFITAVKLMR